MIGNINPSGITHHINPDELTKEDLRDAITKGHIVVFECDGKEWSFVPVPMDTKEYGSDKVALMNRIFNESGVEFEKFRNSAIVFYEGKKLPATILSPYQQATATRRSWTFNLRPRTTATRIYLFVLYEEGADLPKVAVLTDQEVEELRESHHSSPDKLMSLRFFEIDGQLYEQCGKSPRTCMQANVDHAATILQNAITTQGAN